jgi:glycine cleavage system H protein
MSDYPSDLRYTKEHEWARIDGKVATVGITRFAVEQLGDITQVDLPKEGETLKQDDVFGAVESVKAVSDLYSPVSGEVVEVNQEAVDSPELINGEPYGRGWLIKVRMRDTGELDKLLSAEAYEELVMRTMEEETD